jgi:site-specific DNA recombinase
MAEFEVVLITAPDRLARKYVHQVLLLEELQGRGCRVEFVERPMSQDPNDQLLLQIRERWPSTSGRSSQKGCAAGGWRSCARAAPAVDEVPFGYRTDPERPRDPQVCA